MHDSPCRQWDFILEVGRVREQWGLIPWKNSLEEIIGTRAPEDRSFQKIKETRKRSKRDPHISWDSCDNNVVTSRNSVYKTLQQYYLFYS